MTDTFRGFRKVETDKGVYNTLTRYTVGFLVHSTDEKGRGKHVPCGSGVLADIGDVKGIITAAHVAHEIQKYSRVTLFTVVTSGKKVRHLEFDPSQIRVVSEGGRDKSPTGPDLAFIKLPYEIRDSVIAENTLYSFEQRLEHAIDLRILVPHHLLSGVLAERSELRKVSGRIRTDAHCLTHAGGVVENEREVADGHDLFDFHIAHNDVVKRPNSYGGFSGSAVWQTAQNGGRDERLILGIAFYQSEEGSQGDRLITCHGPRSLYFKLINMVRAGFPHEYREIVRPIKSNVPS